MKYLILIFIALTLSACDPGDSAIDVSGGTTNLVDVRQEVTRVEFTSTGSVCIVNKLGDDVSSGTCISPSIIYPTGVQFPLDALELERDLVLFPYNAEELAILQLPAL